MFVTKGLMMMAALGVSNLIDAKLHDALYRPGGLERLRAHRMTGVASPDIRNAERKLVEVLEAAVTPPAPAYRSRRSCPTRAPTSPPWPSATRRWKPPASRP
jgi:hypothetical protein